MFILRVFEQQRTPARHDRAVPGGAGDGEDAGGRADCRRNCSAKSRSQRHERFDDGIRRRGARPQSKRNTSRAMEYPKKNMTEQARPRSRRERARGQPPQPEEQAAEHRAGDGSA